MLVVTTLKRCILSSVVGTQMDPDSQRRLQGSWHGVLDSRQGTARAIASQRGMPNNPEIPLNQQGLGLIRPDSGGFVKHITKTNIWR